MDTAMTNKTLQQQVTEQRIKSTVHTLEDFTIGGFIVFLETHLREALVPKEATAFLKDALKFIVRNLKSRKAMRYSRYIAMSGSEYLWVFMTIQRDCLLFIEYVYVPSDEHPYLTHATN